MTRVAQNGTNISSSSIDVGQRDNKALLNSVRSKVMRSSFSMEHNQTPEKRAKKLASDLYQKLKKRMKYR